MQWTWQSEADAKTGIRGMDVYQRGTLPKRFSSPISIARGGMPASEQHPPSSLGSDSKPTNDHSSEAESDNIRGVTLGSRVLGSGRVRKPDPLSPTLPAEMQQGRSLVRGKVKTIPLARNYKRNESDSDDEDPSDDESDVESDVESDNESDGDETEPADAPEEVISGSTGTTLAAPSSETANPTVANLNAASTTDSQSNTLPSLRHHPEHLAILISGVIVIAICLLSILACLLVRQKKKRNRESTSSPYGQLQNLQWPRTEGLDSEKRPPSSQESLEPQKPPAWDPASSFARPLSKLPKRPGPAVRRMFNPLGSHPLPAEDPSPVGDEELNSPHSTTKSSVKKMMDNVIQLAPQSPTTARTRSSTALPRGQQPSPPSRSIPTPRTPRFISKFSFSTTPRSSGTTSSTWGNGMRRSYISRTSDNDGGTVYTSDSEPPRFRSVNSWVVHQQNKSLKKQQPQSLESEEPPPIAK